jgi:amino-acid N-acetyltransferase
MTIDEGRVLVRDAARADVPAIERALVAADLPVDGVAAGVGGFVVATEGAVVLAAAGLEWHGGHALLRSVVVDPGARNRGLARAVVAELTGRAAAGGADSVYLLTTTSERYFAALGFHPIERADAPQEIRASPEFASICPDNATVMRRRITREDDTL